MELKDWVRAARKEKSWTQTQLGDELGLTKANISGWENARHEPSFSQMLKISELTGFPMPLDLSWLDPNAGPGKIRLDAQGFLTTDYAEQLTLSPLERDLVLALRKLPDADQVETVRDVMHRAEVVDELVKRALAQRGIPISGYVTASRAADTLPSPPDSSGVPPHGAITGSSASYQIVASPISRGREVKNSKEGKK